MTTNWDDPELVLEFIEEATERLDATDSSLLLLEKRPRDAEALATAMGALHSLKGAAGFVGLAHLQEVVHGTESLLSIAGGGSTTAEQGVDLAFDGVTAMREHLDELGRCCREGLPLDRSPILGEFQQRLSQMGIVSRWS